MRRFVIIRHAATPAVRANAFGGDEAAEAEGLGLAAAAAGALPARRNAVSGPERACRQTAEALELDATSEPAIAACDVGDWRGRQVDELAAADPAALMAWMSDPSAAPHGGESLEDFRARVSEWLEAEATGDGFLVAVTDAGVAKMAVLHALGAPTAAFWRVDVAPLGVVEVHAASGRFTLSGANGPLTERRRFG